MTTIYDESQSYAGEHCSHFRAAEGEPGEESTVLQNQSILNLYNVHTDHLKQRIGPMLLK